MDIWNGIERPVNVVSRAKGVFVLILATMFTSSKILNMHVYSTEKGILCAQGT